MIKNVEKAAAVTSEYFSGLNPLNLVGGPLGGLAAAVTPTRTDKEMEEQARGGLGNVLVPGLGPYRYAKRLGHSASKADGAGYGATLLDLFGGMPASAVLGSLATRGEKDPGAALSTGLLVGGVPTALGALAALLTKRRTTEEQAAADKSVLNNLAKLIPGVGTYNLFKRLGSTKKHDEAAEEQDRRERDMSVDFSRKMRETGAGPIGEAIARTVAATK